MTRCPALAHDLAMPLSDGPSGRTPEERRKGFVPCPMCADGERQSAVLGRAIPCPWCGACGQVGLERARALRAQLRAKAAREDAA